MSSLTQPVPLIRPISDLRTNLNDVCAVARESRAPIFMTKNGAPSLVVMDSAAYEEQRMHDRYVLKLREAEIEARYGAEAIPQDRVDARMEEILGRLEA